MEGHVDERVTLLRGVIRELLREPLTAFPVGVMSNAFASTFDVTGVFWSWRTADRASGLLVVPESLRNQGEGWGLWEEGRLFDIHPLVHWHMVTKDARPQSLSRVPRSLVASKDRDFLRDMLRTFGCEEQLTIPCRMDGIEREMFVLARSGCDFTGDDLAVARSIQPALSAVHQSVRLLGRLGLYPAAQHQTFGLTARELAVLQLLSDGLSARGIAKKLATSPRTVEKHLEHVYRKVDVNDRLNAVRVAHEAGLLSHQRTSA